GPPLVAHLVRRARLAVELEHAERPVHVAPVAQPCERLLARIAALREGDGALVEPGLRRQDPAVELAPPARRPRQDAQALELLVRRAGVDAGVEHLDRRDAEVARRDAAVAAEDDDGGVLLRLDLAARGDAQAAELRRHGLPELGLGEEQEVVRAAAPDEERGDHAALGGEEERLARLGREHVVREHALEQVGCVRARHAHVGAGTDVGACNGGRGHETTVVAMFRSMAERKVRAAGYDPGRLPPGQYLTDKWPVLHAGEVPRVDLATWTFRV